MEENGNGQRADFPRIPLIKCEECDEPVEYICVDCERQLCTKHYAAHVCAGNTNQSE
jgi:hypothetical protein